MKYIFSFLIIIFSCTILQAQNSYNEFVDKKTYDSLKENPFKIGTIYFHDNSEYTGLIKIHEAFPLVLLKKESTGQIYTLSSVKIAVVKINSSFFVIRNISDMDYPDYQFVRIKLFGDIVLYEYKSIGMVINQNIITGTVNKTYGILIHEYYLEKGDSLIKLDNDSRRILPFLEDKPCAIDYYYLMKKNIPNRLGLQASVIHFYNLDCTY